MHPESSQHLERFPQLPAFIHLRYLVIAQDI